MIPIASGDTSLASAGGKGHGLVQLANAGLPVPHGFLITTKAYDNFIDANGLDKTIANLIAAPGSEKNPHPLQTDPTAAAAKIQSHFAAASMSQAIDTEIRRAYATLDGEPTVAVRSSATLEDLPELSFAGQQDTYLNVGGADALLLAVQRCWASLWNSRAISYRTLMHVDQRAVSMAVVVQVMVNAEVSGVLFTANPTTGERSEIVINASFGLGEAIVSGKVTPDWYVLDRSSSELRETRLGAKEQMVVLADGQGTTSRSVPEVRRKESSLTAPHLQELVSLSIRAEDLFGDVPQDIEWAVADGVCWLLQSRPITNLPAPPLHDISWDPPSPGAKLIRRQVVENMPDPLSPLFAELYLKLGLDHAIDRVLAGFGLPFIVDEVLQRPMFLTVNGFAYCRADYRLSWRLLRLIPKIIFVALSQYSKIFKNLIPHWRDEALPDYLATVEQWHEVDPASASDTQLLSGVRALAEADALYWFDVATVMGLAKITDGLLNRFLTSRTVPGTLTSGVFLRGFASKTLQAQEDLEAIAGRIDKPLRELVVATPAQELLAALSHPTPDLAQHRRALLADLESYFERYGHQIYTLDFAQPTQGEDPMPVLLSLQTLVNDDSYVTRERQASMARARDMHEQDTLHLLGPVRRRLFRKLLSWAQHCGPHREEALFHMGAGWPSLRRMALELGRRLSDAGSLTDPQDVFYLETAELESAIAARATGNPCPGLAKLAGERQALRAARMQLHPPAMVPEKSRWKIGPIDLSVWETQKRNRDDSNTLEGFAVSPGKVTGIATVILSPQDFAQMKPDTILVCPTTTPAWTPLFTQALALVTDIGGILAHGSIVAREYGIPAVMGLGNITQRVVTGQRISVDGDTGMVTLCDAGES